MFKIGLKLWSTNTDHYLREAKKLYEEGFFDYIELYIVPNTLQALSKWKEYDFPFIIHAPHFVHGFNLADAQKKYSNFLIYKEVKRFADELKALFIIFHGGIDGDINETIQQLASFRDSRTLIENKPYQALPNKMGGKFCRGATIEEIKLVKDKVKCEFCLDFGHAICAANSLGINIYEYCRELLEFKPQMYHLTDLIDITSPYDSHLHLGTGELDFKRIFEMIPNTSYITFETPKNIKTNLNDFVEDIAWFRNFINDSITLN